MTDFGNPNSIRVVMGLHNHSYLPPRVKKCHGSVILTTVFKNCYEKSLTTLINKTLCLNTIPSCGILESKITKKLQGNRNRLHYVSNIYVVSDPKNPDNEGKYFFKYGKKIFEQLKEAISPV